MGDSKRPLYILILGCMVNIVLDVVFVAVFNWGVAGAAWATIGCETISAVLGISYLMEMMGGMGINSIEALKGNRLMLRGIGLTDKELEILGILHAGQ